MHLPVRFGRWPAPASEAVRELVRRCAGEFAAAVGRLTCNLQVEAAPAERKARWRIVQAAAAASLLGAIVSLGIWWLIAVLK